MVNPTGRVVPEKAFDEMVVIEEGITKSSGRYKLANADSERTPPGLVIQSTADMAFFTKEGLNLFCGFFRYFNHWFSVVISPFLFFSELIPSESPQEITIVTGKVVVTKAPNPNNIFFISSPLKVTLF